VKNKEEQLKISKDEIILFRNLLLDWSKNNLRSFPWRKEGVSNYKKVITEIFLQRTKTETISKFIPSFYRQYPSWKKLSLAPEKELRKFVEPVGLVNSRVDVLQKLSSEMVKHNGRIPCHREEIDKLPGVGQYIGNSIELLCCGKSLPLLDVNMARVLERYFGKRKLADIRYDPYLQELAKIVVDCDDPVKVNFAIIDFSHLACTINKPKCGACVLNNKCNEYTRKRKWK